ncbi:MAG: 4-hydroxy-tetrahydrodipicolinate reductase [Pseudomonadota bacterium]
MAEDAVNVVLVGATGRMGQALIRMLPEFPRLRLQAALTLADHPDVGADAGEHAGTRRLGVPLSTDLVAALESAQLVIDFSSAAATAATLGACVQARVPLLIGTTGLDPGLQSQLQRASLQIPLLVAANTSLALNLLLELVRQAAAVLPLTYDIEVFETHHRHKVDAPSGTALALAQAAAAGRGTSLPTPQLTGAVPGAREKGAIGFAVARGGDVVGEHEVRFLGTGEQIKFAHVATDRNIFARGALAAGLWLSNQRPGRYSMSDVLSLKTTS